MFDPVGLTTACIYPFTYVWWMKSIYMIKLFAPLREISRKTSTNKFSCSFLDRILTDRSVLPWGNRVRMTKKSKKAFGKQRLVNCTLRRRLTNATLMKCFRSKDRSVGRRYSAHSLMWLELLLCKWDWHGEEHLFWNKSAVKKKGIPQSARLLFTSDETLI
jgi:hypothetical protein